MPKNTPHFPGFALFLITKPQFLTLFPFLSIQFYFSYIIISTFLSSIPPLLGPPSLIFSLFFHYTLYYYYFGIGPLFTLSPAGAPHSNSWGVSMPPATWDPSPPRNTSGVGTLKSQAKPSYNTIQYGDFCQFPWLWKFLLKICLIPNSPTSVKKSDASCKLNLKPISSP